MGSCLVIEGGVGPGEESVEEVEAESFRWTRRTGIEAVASSEGEAEREEEAVRRRVWRWLMAVGELELILFLFDDDDGDEEGSTDGEFRSCTSLIDVFPLDRVFDGGVHSEPFPDEETSCSLSFVKSDEGCSSSSASSCRIATRGMMSRMMGRGRRSAGVSGGDEDVGDGGEVVSSSSLNSSNLLFPSFKPNASRSSLSSTSSSTPL